MRAVIAMSIPGNPDMLEVVGCENFGQPWYTGDHLLGNYKDIEAVKSLIDGGTLVSTGHDLEHCSFYIRDYECDPVYFGARRFFRHDLSSRALFSYRAGIIYLFDSERLEWLFSPAFFKKDLELEVLTHEKAQQWRDKERNGVL